MTRISHPPALTALADSRARHAREFLASGDALAFIHGLSRTVDTLIQTIAGIAPPQGMALIACGGYGREEMFPHSDIDLLLLYDATMHNEASLSMLIEPVLYALWDSGFKTGHMTLTQAESLALAKSDMTLRTSLLDRRLITGDAAMFNHFCDALQEGVIAPDQIGFVEAKLKERDARHKRYGDSRYLLEPNVKESKGALRDLHTLHWLARHVYNVKSVAELVGMELLTSTEYTLYASAYAFLCKIRAHLHLCSGKAEDRLTFDKQQTLAERLHYKELGGNKAVERLMKQYFSTAITVGSLTRILCALLEEENKRKPIIQLGWAMHYPWRLNGFMLDAQRLNVWSEDEFEHNPIRMLELFYIAQEHKLDIHPQALRLVAQNLHKVDAEFIQSPTANAIFLSILLSRQDPAHTLRLMNEVGLLGAFIPDFGRIFGQMQFNLYHIYTVDEHSIVALGILREIERGKLRNEVPLATDLVRRIHSRKILYLALFCHDIAKGLEGDHSELGEGIAIRLAERLGFSAEEARTTGWLVRNHLLLTHTAFKRDLNDPKTIQNLVESVQSVERLRMLLVLTVADVRATGPSVWNAWKGTLLRELYSRTERMIRTGQSEQPEQYARKIRQSLAMITPKLERGAIEKYLEASPPVLLSYYPAQTHASIMRIIQLVQQGAKIAMDVRHDDTSGISEIRLCAHDNPGLFAQLTAAFPLAGATIRSAQVFTLANGLAVDVFQVQSLNAGAFSTEEQMARLKGKLEQAVDDALNIAQEFENLQTPYPTRNDALAVRGEVFVENEASHTHTVLEITAHDRRGLLHDIARTLAALRLTIASAHISTYGEQAVDVFYVKDGFGMKIEHEKKIAQIRQRLLECLG